jgi:cation diffusion facilitator family transporter
MNQNKKIQTARLSIISNTSLILLKLGAGIVSGSVSIISEAIHSTMDLLAALIAFFSIKASGKQPDKRHPYGHGKIENISGVIEGLLIFVAAAWIIYEAVHKITQKTPIESLGWGVLVMLISAVVNLIVSRRLYQVAKETDSIALEADALHLKTDVYTSAGVGVGLGLIWLTGWHFLDPIIAILVALLIIKEAYVLISNAFAPLLDASLTEDEEKIIVEAVLIHGLKHHNLKTRKSGHYRFAEFHLEMSPEISLGQVHTICDEIEEYIKKHIPYIEVNIHVEPV